MNKISENDSIGDIKKVIEIIIRSSKEALEELQLSNESVSKILANEEQVYSLFKSLIFTKLKGVSAVGLYSDEEVISNLGYPSFVYRNLREQKLILEKYFGDLGRIDNVYPGRQLPLHSELFLIPDMELIGNNLLDAMNTIISILEERLSLNIYNSFVSRHLSYDKISIKKRTLESISKIKSIQNGERTILIPAQLGIKHRGRSGRRSDECMLSNEFGLTPYHVGIILITHPERMSAVDTDLSMLCTGMTDELDRHPFFGFINNSVDHNLLWNSLSGKNFSTPTGFII